MSADDRVQQYLDALDRTSREALSDLRDHVVARYPDVTGHIRYRMPLFKLDGRPFVGFRAAKQHLALYVWSDQVIAELDDLLARPRHGGARSASRASIRSPRTSSMRSSTVEPPRSDPPETLPAEPRSKSTPVSMEAAAPPDRRGRWR